MEVILLAMGLQTLAIIVLWFMIMDERRKTKQDITDVKTHFIKELIEHAKKAETK